MPRAGLSRAVVVREGAAVADEVGWDRLTLAQVAQRLGVRLPSLYKHVDGLDALRRDIAVLAAGQLGECLREAAVGRSGGDALRAVCGAYRAYARSHPGRYLATIRAPEPDDADLVAAAEAILHTVYAVLAAYGLAGDDAVDATRALRAALHGFASLEGAGGFGMPQDVERSFSRMVSGLDAAFTSWRSNGHPPVVDGASSAPSHNAVS
ncbi:MAG TPA: WHG domain-containing protein [Jatrophihabitans sp.]|nr:WHG domain-containing protein [Jatrophihabitans sp.]